MFLNTPDFDFSAETSAARRREIKDLGRRTARSRPIAAMIFLSAISVLIAGTCPSYGAPTPPAAVGTEAQVGQVDGLAVSVKVQGPSTQQTPLQVACVFE